MQTTNRENPANPLPDEDLVANFRLQFHLYFGLTTFLLLSPFAVNHMIAGRVVMAMTTSLIVLIAAVNSVSIYRRRKQPIPFAYFYVLIMATLVSGLFLQGESIIYWYYPFAFIVLSSVGHHQARIMLFISLAILAPTAFYTIDPATAARFSVTYLMVCLLGSQVLRLLDKVQQQQAVLAITDPLTGALNRRSMLPEINDAAEGCRRGLGTASLLTIDIDHFKQINDTFGH